MKNPLFSMEFFETYYYANIIHNVLGDMFEYLRNLHNWHEDREVSLFLSPFPKWSILHDYAEYVIKDLMCERIEEEEIHTIVNNPRTNLWIDKALKHHGIKTEGFRAWLDLQNINLTDATEDNILDYHEDLSLTGELDSLLKQLSEEVFYLLFANRSLLAKLNNYVAHAVSNLKIDDLEDNERSFLQKDGVPSRVHIPEWAKRAVFFRDRGMCAACNKDLSGVISINEVEHYDHIIPLAVGGINDVTNLQLMCGACNLKKGRRMLPTSKHYQAWYPCPD